MSSGPSREKSLAWGYPQVDRGATANDCGFLGSGPARCGDPSPNFPACPVWWEPLHEPRHSEKFGNP